MKALIVFLKCFFSRVISRTINLFLIKCTRNATHPYLWISSIMASKLIFLTGQSMIILSESFPRSKQSYQYSANYNNSHLKGPYIVSGGPMILEKVPTISQSHEQHLVMIVKDVWQKQAWERAATCHHRTWNQRKENKDVNKRKRVKMEVKTASWSYGFESAKNMFAYGDRSNKEG